jgi:ribosomal protein S25
MVYAPKEDRNASIVENRVKNPRVWTWGKLGQKFGVHRSVAKEIFERDLEKFANENQISKYEKIIAQLDKERGQKRKKFYK